MRFAFRCVAVTLLLSLSSATLPAQTSTPTAEFHNMCAQDEGAFELSCVRGNPTDVPPQARAQFSRTCMRIAESRMNACLAKFIKNTGYLYAHYMLLGVLYAPPGKASSASLGNSTQTGTTYGISSNFTSTDTVGWEVSLGFMGNGGSVGGSDSSSTGNGHSDQKTISTTLTDNVSARSGLNMADADQQTFHDADQFLLWVNPMITLVESPLPGQVHASTAVGPGESMNLVWVTAGQLRHKTIPPEKLADQQIVIPGSPTLTLTGLHVLSDDDAAAILSQDLLINQPLDQPPDPVRFRLIDSRPLQGPDENGNLSQQFTMSNANSEVVSDTSSQGGSSSFSAGIHETSPFNSASITFTNSWSWSTTVSDGRLQGRTTTAAVQLASSTKHCCGIVPDQVTCRVTIYEDMTWHSFAFIPERTCMPFRNPAGAASPLIAGVQAAATAHLAMGPNHALIAGAAAAPFALEGKVAMHGKPSVEVRVSIYRADGTMVYRTVTDRKGRFTVADLPNGRSAWM